MKPLREGGGEGFKFRRTLHGDSLDLWNNLKTRCEEIYMVVDKDMVERSLSADKKFSVKCLYRELIVVECYFPQKFLRKVKVPVKIKVFLWLVNTKSILTMDSLLKSGWKWSKICVFCGKDETVNHLMFTCSAASLVLRLLKCTFGLRSTPSLIEECFGLKPFKKMTKKMVLVGISSLFWTIWKCRNGVIFLLKKSYCDSMTLVKLMCHWIVGWSILQTKGAKHRAAGAGNKTTRTCSKWCLQSFTRLEVQCAALGRVMWAGGHRDAPCAGSFCSSFL